MNIPSLELLGSQNASVFGNFWPSSIAMEALILAGILVAGHLVIAKLSFKMLGQPLSPAASEADAPQSPLAQLPPNALLLDQFGSVAAAGHQFADSPRKLSDALSLEATAKILRAIGEITDADCRKDVHLGNGNSIRLEAVTCPFGESRFLVTQTKTSTAEDETALRILVADDEESYRSVVSRFLQKSGHQVAIGAHGREAVELAENWNPDIILMDLDMPIMNGYEASSMIRKTGATDDLKIIAISATIAPDARDRCDEAGIDAFFRKPFNLSDLNEVIGQHAGIALAS